VLPAPPLSETMRTLRPRFRRTARAHAAVSGVSPDPVAAQPEAEIPVVPDGGVSLEALDARATESPELLVEESRNGGRHTLALEGELALGSVSTLEHAVARLWSQPVTSVTLDLRLLTFIDSSGLWTVTRLHKRCAHESVEFRVIPGPESIQQVFELTGLSDVIPFAVPPSRDGA
jgi:anti-sigma B factor antagonist